MQAVLLLSVLRGRANAAFLLLDGGEGLSAQDHVDRTENTFCATQTVGVLHKMLPSESYRVSEKGLPSVLH